MFSHVPIGCEGALTTLELGVEKFYATYKNYCQAEAVDQGEREEIQVDSLLEALLKEHGHVDAVGRDADEEENGDDDGRFDFVKEELRLMTDQVVGVVPRDGRVHAQDDAVLWGNTG